MGRPPLARFMLPLPFCAARPFRSSPGVSYTSGWAHLNHVYVVWICYSLEAVPNKAEKQKPSDIRI